MWKTEDSEIGQSTRPNPNMKMGQHKSRFGRFGRFTRFGQLFYVNQ